MKQWPQSVTADARRTGSGVFHRSWCVARWFLFGLVATCFFIFLTAESVLASEKAESSVPEEKSQDSFSEKNSSPRRIVSINLCTDELLLRLVEPGRVAALTRFSDNADVSTVWETAQGIKKTELDIESILACSPDLLLGGRFNNREALHFFQYTDIPVIIFGVPKSFEDIYGDIRTLAEAVGEPEEGETIIRQMQTGLAELKAEAGESRKKILLSGATQDDGKGNKRRAIFFQSGGFVPGSETFENAIMEAAGLENLAATLGIKDYGSLSLEKLIEMKPDILIFASDQKKQPTVRGEVLAHPAIRKSLSHVKTVTLPSATLSCGSPASVEAVRILVKETAL